MNLYRLKTSDIEGIQIDYMWQQFLLKEHNVSSKLGDYYYKDVQGNMRVLSKELFERLFDPVEEVPVVVPGAAMPQNWLQRILPKISTQTEVST